MALDFNRLGQDFAAFVADPTSESSTAYAERMGLKVSHTNDIRGKRYHIVRYDKTKYSDPESGFSMTDEIAMLRSLIISDGKIRCVSLPKATKEWDSSPNGSRTVLLEGPMINVFYYADDQCQDDDTDGKGWQMTTRSVFGARNSYFDDDDGSKITFRRMFLEAMPSEMFSSLDRNTTYSYVVRHPKNRDVYGVTSPSLVLTASFVPRDDTRMIWDYVAPVANDILTDMVAPSMGRTAAWTDENGNLVRAKNLNDDYKTLRKLRGTQPKLKFHYLTLRRQRGGVGNYLAKFPEHTTIFNGYREQIHDFTKTLQRNYWDCYVKHSKPLSEYDGRYKQHMYNLHTAFKNTKSPQLIPEVIRYVNTMPPAQLMYSLNWEHRPQRRQQQSDTTNHMEA